MGGIGSWVLSSLFLFVILNTYNNLLVHVSSPLHMLLGRIVR